MASATEIEEQAARWLIELDADSTPGNWARHEQWMASNPLHRVAFLRLSLTWGRANALRKLRPLDGHVDPDLLARLPRELGAPGRGKPARPPSRWARFGWRGIGLAAALGVGLAVCGALTWQLTRKLQAPVHETSFGGTERVALDDGSSMQLNSDSLVRVRYTKTLRNIELERGEVLFDVAHDVRRPFQVSAGTTRTIAGDSRFSVRRKSSELVEVQVAEGNVVFERARAPLSFDDGGARFTRTLWAGYAASAGPGGVTVRNTGTATVQRHLAWANGLVWFLGETLEEAVLEINRYNRRPLVISDRRIAGLRVSGTFEATDPASFVTSLEQALKVRALQPARAGERAAIRLVSTQR